jgi:hypothetical protein
VKPGAEHPVWKTQSITGRKWKRWKRESDPGAKLYSFVSLLIADGLKAHQMLPEDATFFAL